MSHTRRTVGTLALLLVTALPGSLAAAPVPAVEYLSPAPGAGMVLPQTNVILRPGGIVDPASLASESLLVVIGSISGPHSGLLALAGDRRTLTFRPDLPFVSSETVTCRLGPGLVTDTRADIPAGEFTFTIAGPDREALRSYVAAPDSDELAAAALRAPRIVLRQSAAAAALPSDFPNVAADSLGPTAAGRLFLSDIYFQIAGPRVPSYLMILNNDGTPYWYKHLDGIGLDFKLQPATGQLTYYDTSGACFYAMDAHYAVVDSFRCGNGYTTDSHDLVLLPNGHAVLMSYDPEVVDLSAIGGYPDAIVIGLIIQELDQDKNVVFQWRSWDHFQVTDMLFHPIAAPVVDYVHGNSIDVDPDGNFILSSRHMNEVTKISRSTGEILWRMGGKNNQFTFSNDPIPFSHQHDVKLLSTGHLTMFDNGNFRVPQFSRALEYSIDETQKTATLVWEKRLTPDVFGVAFGTVQRFENGNTLVGWGATTPTLTELDPDGNIVERLTFDPGIASYRAFRFEWPPVKPALVDLSPGTVVGGSRGSSIRATIEPDSADFALADVEVSTIRLEGVPADTATAALGSNALSVDFSEEAVKSLLQPGSNRVAVSGALATGDGFRGFADLRLLDSSTSPAKTQAHLVSRPGAVPVVMTVPGGLAIRSAGARARFAVYDARGRLVRRWKARLDSGQQAAWDGRQSDGREASSGIYFVRVENGQPGQALKVAIVR
ncbi:MAG: aryl-sulfate sulfotransferase [Bacteroidota bacterium]